MEPANKGTEMSTETVRRIELLHRLYCTQTARHVPLNSGREHEWLELITAIRDMQVEPERAVVLVAQRITRLVKEKKLWESALDFRRFVREDEFTEQLAAALSEQRKPVRSAAIPVVEAFTGRKMEPKLPEPRKADEVLASPAFKAFCDLRKTL